LVETGTMFALLSWHCRYNDSWLFTEWVTPEHADTHEQFVSDVTLWLCSR